MFRFSRLSSLLRNWLRRPSVERVVRRAAELGFGEVFALTRVPGFFHKLGFVTVEKGRFPLKVWSDCARCARAPCCDETAVHLTGVASRRAAN